MFADFYFRRDIGKQMNKTWTYSCLTDLTDFTGFPSSTELSVLLALLCLRIVKGKMFPETSNLFSDPQSETQATFLFFFFPLKFKLKVYENTYFNF